MNTNYLEGVGEVNISDAVIATISNISANEISGISGVSGGLSDVFSSNNTKGIKIVKKEDSIDLFINVSVDFGTKIAEAAAKVQKSVKTAVQNTLDIKVSSVNVNVVGMNLPKIEK